MNRDIAVLKQKLALMNDNPSTLAIVPSLLAVAIMHGVMAGPPVISQYLPDILSMSSQPHEPSGQVISAAADGVADEEVLDLQKFAALMGMPDSMLQPKYKKEPVIELPASLYLSDAKQLVLKVRVSALGQVDYAGIEQSSGDAALDALVLKAFDKVLYYPFNQTGEPRAVLLRQMVQVAPTHRKSFLAQLDTVLPEGSFRYRKKPVLDMSTLPQDQPVHAGFILFIDNEGAVYRVEMTSSSGSAAWDKALYESYKQAVFYPHHKAGRDYGGKMQQSFIYEPAK